jgi:hypothetical protein
VKADQVAAEVVRAVQKLPRAARVGMAAQVLQAMAASLSFNGLAKWLQA